MKTTITRKDLERGADVLTRSIPNGPKFEISLYGCYYQLNIDNHKRTIYSGSAREVYAYMQGVAAGIITWISN